jgi:protein arginine kinase activator
MLCQHCQQREAKVRVIKTIKGQTQEMNLCEQCAQKIQELNIFMHPGVAVPDFLQALFGFMGKPEKSGAPLEENCPLCGLTFSQITRAGKLGCSVCYDKFEPQLESLLRRIHGGGQHVGKIPRRRGSAIKDKLELQKLKEKLAVSIQQEKFEEAALIRDQIKRLDLKAGGE